MSIVFWSWTSFFGSLQDEYVNKLQYVRQRQFVVATDDAVAWRPVREQEGWFAIDQNTSSRIALAVGSIRLPLLTTSDSRSSRAPMSSHDGKGTYLEPCFTPSCGINDKERRVITNLNADATFLLEQSTPTSRFVSPVVPFEFEWV